MYIVTRLTANEKLVDALVVFRKGFKCIDDAESAILEDLKISIDDNEIDETPNAENMYEIAERIGFLYEICFVGEPE